MLPFVTIEQAQVLSFLQEIKHKLTAGNKITIPPLPAIVITPATDTTYVTPYSYATTQKTNPQPSAWFRNIVTGDSHYTKGVIVSDGQLLAGDQ